MPWNLLPVVSDRDKRVHVRAMAKNKHPETLAEELFLTKEALFRARDEQVRYCHVPLCVSVHGSVVKDYSGLQMQAGELAQCPAPHQ